MENSERIELSADLHYVNALLLQMIKGVEDVLGTNGLNVVLGTSGLERYINNPPPDDLGHDVLAREFAQLHESIETFTGRAGKGMLRRIGRSAFDWASKEQIKTMGLANLALAVLPQKLRMQAVLMGIKKGLVNNLDYSKIDIAFKDGVHIFTNHTNAIPHMRTSDTPVCHMLVGSLAQAMGFATGKDWQDFEVIETECRATGAASCRFEIRTINEA